MPPTREKTRISQALRIREHPRHFLACCSSRYAAVEGIEEPAVLLTKLNEVSNWETTEANILDRNYVSDLCFRSSVYTVRMIADNRVHDELLLALIELAPMYIMFKISENSSGERTLMCFVLPKKLLSNEKFMEDQGTFMWRATLVTTHDVAVDFDGPLLNCTDGDAEATGVLAPTLEAPRPAEPAAPESVRVFSRGHSSFVRGRRCPEIHDNPDEWIFISKTGGGDGSMTRAQLSIILAGQFPARAPPTALCARATRPPLTDACALHPLQDFGRSRIEELLDDLWSRHSAEDLLSDEHLLSRSAFLDPSNGLLRDVATALLGADVAAEWSDDAAEREKAKADRIKAAKAAKDDAEIEANLARAKAAITAAAFAATLKASVEAKKTVEVGLTRASRSSSFESPKKRVSAAAVSVLVD